MHYMVAMVTGFLKKYDEMILRKKKESTACDVRALVGTVKTLKRLF